MMPCWQVKNLGLNDLDRGAITPQGSPGGVADKPYKIQGPAHQAKFFGTEGVDL